MGNKLRSWTGRAFKLALIATVAMLASLPVSQAVAGSGRSPLGYQLMCREHPEECRGGGKAKVTMTNQLMSTLKKINGSVNRSIRPRKDPGPDVWSVSVSSGDCEDYVLAKRRALIKAGVPSSSLRIAYVKTRQGVGHAILVVKTNGKDLVLDNLTQTIKPLSQTGYRIVSMSGSNPRKWS